MREVKHPEAFGVLLLNLRHAGYPFNFITKNSGSLGK
jgi:hypothetical protein